MLRLCCDIDNLNISPHAEKENRLSYGRTLLLMQRLLESFKFCSSICYFANSRRLLV